MSLCKKISLVLIGIFILALITFLGVFDWLFPKKYVGIHYDEPCLTPTTQKAVNYSLVHLRVLNASSHAGLGQAVNLALVQRGFSSHGYDNYDKGNLYNTKISFGIKSLNEAYTLATVFDNVVLQMDNRDDELIDVIVGENFNDLKPISDESQIQYIYSPSNCVDPSKIKTEPALEHTAYYPPKDTSSEDTASDN
ncbi:MAG: LytR C-terminal domain-containing protein [Bifidobacteriaceae bacterium]|jgi:hypothetical protein|nr:LytR C-terminal domain-containing protein [Bifidobacteriaceae bacterium]